MPDPILPPEPPKDPIPKPLAAIMDSDQDIAEQFRPLFSKDAAGKWRPTGIAGFRTEEDIARVTTAKQQEVDAHKITKAKLAALETSLGEWATLKPEEITALVTGHEELRLKAESAGRVTDEQVEKIVATRLKAQTVPLERKITDLEKTKAALEETIAGHVKAENLRMIHDEVRRARIEAKVLDVAEEDALFAAERMFEVDTNGKVVTKEGVGVTPGVDAALWFVEMQPKRPRWWPDTVGGGATGADGRTLAIPKNPWSIEHWNKTEQGRFITAHGEEKAKAAAALAGSSLFAAAPPPKR